MASVHKREGKRATTYRVIWRLPDGSQRSKTFKSWDEAKAFRSDVEVLERRGRAPDPQRGSQTLCDWSEAFLTTLHLKPKTAETYRSLLRSRILPRFGHRSLSSITRLDVQRWIADMAADVSPRRTKNAHALLSQMLSEAVRHDLILSNAAEGVSLPRSVKQEIRPLSLDQLRLVAAQCGRYEPLVLWLGIMGTRWAEAIGLTWDQLQDGIVTIDSSLSEVNGRFHRVGTKTFEIRRLPIPPAILELLPPQEHEYVFSTTYGNPIRSAKFRTDVFIPAVQSSGLPRMRIHHLRHTCASLLVQEGANPKVVQQWLGHKDVALTLNTYSHLFPSDLDAVSHKFDRLLAK